MNQPFNKVLLLSASAGAGHVRAADALVAAFQKTGAAKEIIHFDTLQYTSKAFRGLYSKAYFDIANKAPDILGWLYDALDKPWKNERRIRALEKLNIGLFVRLIERIQPDLVVNTHFLPTDIIAYLRSKKKVHCKQAVVVTDFDIHAMWLNRNVEQYFVACDENREYLRVLGVPQDNIAVSGIPIDSVFGQDKNKDEMRRKLGMNPTLPVVLISAGGFGIGNVESMVRSLSLAEMPMQVFALCGRNADMKKQVADIAGKSKDSVVQLHGVGYTTAMDEYMSAADCIIGKPGGLTASESLAKGLPMVIFNPIPGQEERNSDYLLENGAGIRCNNLATLTYKVSTLLSSPERMARMCTNARQVSRPDAAFDVVQTLLSRREQFHA